MVQDFLSWLLDGVLAAGLVGVSVGSRRLVRVGKPLPLSFARALSSLIAEGVSVPALYRAGPRCRLIALASLVNGHRASMLSANSLKQNGVPVKVQELLLSAGEPSHINNLCGVYAHSLERETMSDRRDYELVLESNEPAIEEMINAWRQKQAVLTV
jgi:hypothetical protein